MTPRTSKSSRVATAKPRSAGGVLGGFLGMVSMSAIAGLLVTAAVTPIVALAGSAATTAVDIFEKLPSQLDPSQLALPTSLWAKKGDDHVKFAEFYEQDREPVAWEGISQYVKDALVGIEDPRFYTHGGVDARAASRAVVQNLAGDDMSGASTITMQYVRNVLIQDAMAISDEEERDAAYNDAMRQEMDRKLKEMRLAISVEKKYTKDEILTGYLNTVLFGRTIYGIESASQYFYGKSNTDLTLAEAASLVAIVNSPTRYQIDIEENIPANKERRDLILQQMYSHGKITLEQRDEAIATEVEPNITPRVQGCAAAEEEYNLGHVCDYVQHQLLNDPEFGEEGERDFNVRRGGYDIYTSIDLDMQQAAVEGTRANVPQVMDGIDVGSATVATEVNTGRILAMTQNRPFSTDESLQEQGYTAINYSADFDYGGSSGFQIGSTFKSVTLAEWLRAGHSVRDIVNASGRTIQESSIRAQCLGGVYGQGSWMVGNDNLRVSGSQSVLTVIAQSLNGGVISMQQRLDLCDTYEMASNLGLHLAKPDADGNTDLPMVPSGVYGGVGEMSPLTVSLAYGAFAGGGTVCEPTAIDEIKGPDGEPVPFTKNKCREAISPEVAAGVAYALEYNVQNGLATHTRSQFGIPHLAKTGTTDLYKDNWTVGGSSKVTIATWVGNAGPTCYGPGNCDRVDTRNFGGYGGLTSADTRIWPPIMQIADQKYGGEGFGEPAESALRQTMVRVPDVTGMSYDEAERALEAANFMVRDGGEVDSSEPRGTVARTDPSGGGEVGLGTEITIYRSLGNAGKIPDDLGGMTGREAESALRSANFTSISMECSGSGSPDPGSDEVVSVSPSAGSEVRFNTRVTLTVECD